MNLAHIRQRVTVLSEGSTKERTVELRFAMEI
jgi:hypothetical protein